MGGIVQEEKKFMAHPSGDWKRFFVVVALSLNRRYCRVIDGLIASKTKRNTRRRRTARE
jgi:hypothetical protein